MRRLLVIALALSAAACNESSDTDAGNPPADWPPAADGKADFADLAQPLAYGATVVGSAKDQTVALYRVEAAADDVLALVVKRTGGDLDPRTEVFTTYGTEVKHDRGSFERLGEGANRKTFTLSAGTYLVAVRADRWRGAGEFTLQAECAGGPCAGEFPGDDNDVVLASICIGKARSCAFGKLDPANPVDRAGAQALFDTCLAEATLLGGEACDPEACAIDNDAGKLCGRVVDALTFYGDKSAECRTQVTGCLESCTEQEENSPYLEEDDIEFWMTGEALCWDDPNYFGSCDEFARAHAACGGAEHPLEDTWDSCQAYCAAVRGPWNGEVDEICYDDCTYVCDDIQADCEARCSDDGDCYSACVADDPRTGDGCDYL